MNPLHIALKELFKKKFLLWVNVLILGFSLGSLIIISVVERSIRFGSATAADPFDVVVGTEKDQTKLLLYSVFLQASESPPLFDLNKLKMELKAYPEAKVSGMTSSDSFKGHKLIGVESTFFELSSLIKLEDKVSIGDFTTAIVGARVDIDMNTTIGAHHKDSAEAEETEHEAASWTVGARLAKLNSPYDDAILVSLASLWKIHGIGPGIRPVSAALIHPNSISDAYQIKASLEKAGFTVIFPGEMLASFFSLTDQAKGFALFLVYLVQILVGLGLMFSLMSLFSQQMPTVAIMMAQGAPTLFLVLFYFIEAVYILLGSFIVSLILSLVFSQVILQQIGSNFSIELDPQLELGDFGPVLTVMAFGLVLSLLASFFSSSKISSRRIKQ